MSTSRTFLEIRRLLPPLLLATTVGGCAALSPAPQGKLFEREGVSMITVPSNSRETYFSDPTSRERHCRAPSPDVSITASEGVSLSALRQGVSEDASKGALSLGGRDPAVLITRELMYRACEASNNLNLGADESLKFYRDVMDVIAKISASQTGTGTAAASASASDARVQAPPPRAASKPSAAGDASNSSSSASGDDSDSNSSASGDDSNSSDEDQSSGNSQPKNDDDF